MKDVPNGFSFLSTSTSPSLSCLHLTNSLVSELMELLFQYTKDLLLASWTFVRCYPLNDNCVASMACHMSSQRSPPSQIPHDIQTRWNSTYDMLKFCSEYRAPIDVITADKSVGMQKYEMEDEDWTIVTNLMHVLKVWWTPFQLFRCWYIL